MKLRTDDRARLYGRDILKPNTDYQADVEGNRIVLVELVPKEAAPRPRLVKKHGYTVAIGSRPITQDDVRKALDEFP